MSPDPVSKMILENHKISFDGKIPVFVSGDGNCLFNSLSVGLVGHEKFATEVRVRTCLEMDDPAGLQIFLTLQQASKFS